mgnify:CR=1 FL=1
MKTPSVVFDFDGTICDSFTAAMTKINDHSEEFGYKNLALDNLDLLRMLSMKDLLKSISVPDETIPRLVKVVLADLQRDIERLQPFDGIGIFLQELQRKGYRLAILTSNSKVNVSAFLKKNHLEYFELIAESGLFGKDQAMLHLYSEMGMRPDQVAYVGDEVRDVEAAKKVGTPVVAVTWGFDHRVILEKAGPDHLIDSIPGLSALFD